MRVVPVFPGRPSVLAFEETHQGSATDCRCFYPPPAGIIASANQPNTRTKLTAKSSCLIKLTHQLRVRFSRQVPEIGK